MMRMDPLTKLENSHKLIFFIGFMASMHFEDLAYVT